MKSIGHRLYRQNGIIILSIVLILELIFLWGVRNYYFESTKKQLFNRAVISGDFYNRYLINETIHGKARYILENESKNKIFYMQVLDSNQTIVTDSNGLMTSTPIDEEDIVEALFGRSKIVMARDKETSEKIMAISIPLYHLDNISGALRYIVSVEEVDEMVGKISSISFIIGLGVIVVIFLLSSFLARDIVEPVKELTNIAEVMAGGDFSKRAIKRNNDEIGRLSDTLNFMAEEIQRSNSIKNEFITSVSHELRTPLTAIKGWSEIILAGEIDDPEEEQEGLKIIYDEAGRLSGLVEELLDFSKLESGKITLNLTKINIKELMEIVYSNFKKRFEIAEIEASLILDEKDCIVIGDTNRLKQVLINIIDNSIKFTEKDGRIIIRTLIREKYVLIEVEDNGIGIPTEEIEKITEKFYKGKSKGAGSGIGLAICKEIIDMHHGNLHINSIEGEGTKMGIELPIKL
ncbi:HAMP domain-containing sensor histidine kinase [Wukongibacter baidiensis]|uniref:sensor histidine kinase n=1 Tax=Wukongibacter baidiensis TaxID=1723361 RepID=UPI003D7FA847